MTYLEPRRPARPPADPLLSDILRDLSRAPPCDCRRCRGRSVEAEEAAPRRRKDWKILSPAQVASAQDTQKKFGWIGWRRTGAGAQPTMALLKTFGERGGVTGTGEKRRLTPAGRRMLATAQFAPLKPLFEGLPNGGQSIYDIRGAGAPRSDYVGVTHGPAGLRLLEHLQNPRDAIHRRLNGRNAPDLSREVIRVGRTMGDNHRAHIVEALWQEQLRPTWIYTSQHGFDA